MNRQLICVALIAVAGMIAGCASEKAAKPAVSSAPAGNGQSRGRVASTILGEMNGGLVGGTFGDGLSARDKRSALEAEYKALEYTPSGQPVLWQNAGSQYRGQVVAGQPYQVGSQNCRQYTDTIVTSASSKTAKGAACRNSDGSWTPLN